MIGEPGDNGDAVVAVVGAVWYVGVVLISFPSSCYVGTQPDGVVLGMKQTAGRSQD
jgi:hypothetical protein